MKFRLPPPICSNRCNFRTQIYVFVVVLCNLTGVYVWKRKPCFISPDWFVQNPTLIKFLHSFGSCFVHHWNQTFRACLYPCKNTHESEQFVAPPYDSGLTDHCCPQSESLVVCEVDEDLVKRLKEFRFRKETNNAAIISEFYMLYWDRGGKWTG